MLRDFLYLDEPQLDQYISQVEDGLRKTASRSTKGATSRGIAGDAKIVKANHGSISEEAETAEVADTGPAKFERLLALVDGNEDQFGWIDVLQDSDLQATRVGSIVDLSADLFLPDIAKLAGTGGFLENLPLMRMIAGMSPGANMLAGLPSSDQLDTMEAFVKAMPRNLVQGEVLESHWSVIGQIGSMDRDVEGEARVTGKVSKVWGAGTWRPLPGLPVISQLPREQRREFERKGPGDAQKMMWVEGPGLQLDVLAIYR